LIFKFFNKSYRFYIILIIIVGCYSLLIHQESKLGYKITFEIGKISKLDNLNVKEKNEVWNRLEEYEKSIFLEVMGVKGTNLIEITYFDTDGRKLKTIEDVLNDITSEHNKLIDVYVKQKKSQIVHLNRKIVAYNLRIKSIDSILNKSKKSSFYKELNEYVEIEKFIINDKKLDLNKLKNKYILSISDTSKSNYVISKLPETYMSKLDYKKIIFLSISFGFIISLVLLLILEQLKYKFIKPGKNNA